MFSLIDPLARQNRRDFLKIGALGLGGLTLPDLLKARAATAPASSHPERSVIFLFLHGGPSQYETFDPKMSAPDGIRSATGEIKTALPGVTFGSTFERLAARANQLAVVRSYRPGDAGHNIKPIVHAETGNANLGSLYARIAGANHPVSGMPRNVILFPRAVDPKTQAAQLGFGNFLTSGSLGANFAPFSPSVGGSLQENMKLKIAKDQLEDRRQLLAGLDGIKRRLDTTGEMDSLDRFQQQAFDVIMRGAADAFDLSKEDPKVVDRYDTSLLARPDNIDKKWNNYKNYCDNGATLGKLLLLARRLCEAGCGFITVTTNFVWDMHADVNNAGVAEGMRYMGLPLDHAISVFLDDLKERGLSEKILLVVCGEIGRTPRLNAKGGRDHWGNLGPLLFAGGGLKMGQVIGQSTANGGDPFTEPITIANVISTIMHTLLDVSQLRTDVRVPGDVARLVSNAEPIRELFQYS